MDFGKLLDDVGLTASKGLKRILGKALEVVGALGVALPPVSSDLPIPTSSDAIKVFFAGVLLKYIGELHAKLQAKAAKK